MQVVFLGPPGAGKGTQASLLGKALSLPHISTGVLLRKEITDGTRLGTYANEFVSTGKLVPDSVMLDIIEERLAKDDCGEGFILDGYPRNISQAKALDELLGKVGKPLSRVIYIEVHLDDVVKRINERKAKEGRGDDAPGVIGQRLEEYNNKTKPLLDYYEERGLVSKVRGKGTIEEVFKEVLKQLSK